MKKFLFIPFVLFLSVFFDSCEKEYSIDNGGVPQNGGNAGTVTGTSVFTFDGATGNCTAAVVSGIYSTGIELTSANTAVIPVNVTSPGTFTVTTSTSNGITFSGTGTFTTTGAQTITLTGTGSPRDAGTFSYKQGPAGCNFSITVTDISNTPSVFTLGGAPSACTGFTLGGVFTAGAAATAANTVSFQVNVTTAGTYSLSTTAVNGITYSGSGIFSATGAQNVTLKAAGTPATAGSSAFSITQGTSTCTFSVPVAAPASFTLSGAPATCTLATVAGIYQNGTALDAANTVTIEVNVTTIGGYSLTTNVVNGISFTGSGAFTTTGIQNIILTGNGTPAAAGTFTFNPQFGTSGCTFDVVVAVAPIPSGTFSCKVNGTLLNFTDRAVADIFEELSGQPYLYLDGFTAPPNGNEIPEMQIFIEKNDASAVGTGSYNENGLISATGYRIEIDYHEVQADQSVIIWNTSSTIIPPANPAFTINVTEVSATRIKGTFSGSLKHTTDPSDPTIKTVTEGVFDLPIQ